MKKLKLFILLVGVLFIGFGNSNAQKVRDKHKDKNMVHNKLNLTETQKENFTKIRFETEETQIDLEAQLKLNRLEIKKLLNETNFNEAKLLDLTKVGNNINNKIRIAHVEKWLKIRNLLDDDQKEVWKKRYTKMDRTKGLFLDKEKRKNLRKGKKHYFQQMSKKNRIDDKILDD